MNDRHVIVYIAMSLDGYIARPDGDIDWLSLVEQSGEDYGYSDFIKSIDTIIIGRKTYDKVMTFGIGFPHADKECFVITRNKRPTLGNITFYDGDVEVLIAALKGKAGRNIFVDGGAEIVNELMKRDLIDEWIISIIPIVLGEGIRLFQDNRPEQQVTCVECKHYNSGLVQIHYHVNH